MPEKSTKTGETYKIDGKKFVWTTEDGDTVTIPLRIKLKVLRSLSDMDADNVATMFALLEQVAPNQADVLDELDVNEFQRCFAAWQREYNSLNGATLGESSSSSA